MADNDAARPPGNREAKLLLVICLAAAGWFVVVFLLDRLPLAVIPTTYALPIVLASALILAIRLAHKGTAPIPAAVGMIGIVYVVGGVAFDVIATVIHTPELHDESNFVARALLDSGHPLAFVYGYATVAQSLLTALVCTLWIALLRHRGILIASLDHRTFMRFLKSATGGDHLTWRQWIIPMKRSDLPRAYHLFWVMVVLLVAGMIERWYLGLDWFNLVSPARWTWVGLAMTAGLVAYFTWLWVASRHRENSS